MKALSLPKHVLVVEDNYDAADSLVQLLEAFGHHAKAAYTACDALEILNSYPADLLFVDIGLPDMSGYELARRIRLTKHDVMLIALTGYVPDSSLTKAVGFNHQITKPIMLDKLTVLLDSQAA